MHLSNSAPWHLTVEEWKRRLALIVWANTATNTYDTYDTYDTQYYFVFFK